MSPPRKNSPPSLFSPSVEDGECRLMVHRLTAVEAPPSFTGSSSVLPNRLASPPCVWSVVRRHHLSLSLADGSAAVQAASKTISQLKRSAALLTVAAPFYSLSTLTPPQLN